MDKISFIVQIFGIIIFLSLIYLLILKYIIPNLKKVLQVRKNLYENNVQDLYDLKNVELIKTGYCRIMIENLIKLKINKLREINNMNKIKILSGRYFYEKIIKKEKLLIKNFIINKNEQ